MELDVRVKQAVYRHFAERAERPTAEGIAAAIGASVSEVRASFAELRRQRVLVLDADGVSIRMAPPFSGVPTQHVAVVGGRRYFANCAWDVLGVIAALRQAGTVESRCERSGDPYRLEVGTAGPAPSDWLFHCAVPASRWWDDIVFT